MDLNTKINKTTAVVVPAVLVILYTIAFLVLKNAYYHYRICGGHYRFCFVLHRQSLLYKRKIRISLDQCHTNDIMAIHHNIRITLRRIRYRRKICSYFYHSLYCFDNRTGYCICIFLRYADADAYGQGIHRKC